ncbi:lanthionine synthetase LanC family protein [Fodinicola feengrottensis]|uniref:lanthionine synthetase LanC family protein n=1 Tax=Fodinicola feengrottensis TaxID=435914 RepID=UPI0013D617C0
MVPGLSSQDHCDWPRRRASIDRICRWLDQWAQGTAAATWWPESVSRYEHHEQTLARRAPGRPSWCYGTPGIARAQQLAGLARDDSDRARRAEQALAECLADHHQLALIRDASLCHGWAGLLHTTARVAANATDDRLASTALPQLRYRLSEHLRRSGLPGHDGLLTARRRRATRSVRRPTGVALMVGRLPPARRRLGPIERHRQPWGPKLASLRMSLEGIT